MKILSWNINGIRAGERKGIFDWVQEYSPEIICFQETKAQPDQLSDAVLNQKGYHSYWHSAQKKGYSGVATYTKEEPIKIITELGIPEFDQEGRILVTEFQNFILCNVYFPNGKKDEIRLKYKMDFYDVFFNFIESQKDKGKKVIFCGDVNTAHTEIDLSRPKPNSKTSGFLPEERAWIDKVVEHGYIDTLREFKTETELYTWWDLKTRARERNVGWRIDYFFIDKKLHQNLKDAFILKDIFGSDHCPVGIEIF